MDCPLFPCLAVWLLAAASLCSTAAAQNLGLQTYQPANPLASPSPTTADASPSSGPATAIAGSSYQPPKVLKRAPISYPEMAHLNRDEGVVRVKFSLDDQGRVTSAVVSKTSGSVMLDEVVLDPRMKEWAFQPATLDGKPVPSTWEQEFEFRLDPVEEREIAIKRMARPIGTPDPTYPSMALLYNKPEGKTTFGVYWTQGPQGGLVDKVYLIKSSGSGLLDRAALRFAYENWRIDPSKVTKEAFVKTVEFTAPK